MQSLSPFIQSPTSTPIHTPRPKGLHWEPAPNSRNPNESYDGKSNDLSSLLGKLNSLLLTQKEDGDKIQLSKRLTGELEETAEASTHADRPKSMPFIEEPNTDTFFRQSESSSPKSLQCDRLEIPSFTRSNAPTPDSVKVLSPENAASASASTSESMILDSPIERPKAPLPVALSKADDSAPRRPKRKRSESEPPVLDAPKAQRKKLDIKQLRRFVQQQEEH